MNMEVFYMNVIDAQYKILTTINSVEILKQLELIGRVCYKSEDKMSQDSSQEFIKRIISSGHESVIEHYCITVKFICDRGVSHEIVRHRIASYSQESTRYCNYSQDKFGNEITFIKPCFWNKESDEYKLWENTMQLIEKNYLQLLNKGAKPEEARSILPNSLKTEIVVTMNLREWRHFFKLRTSNKAHPQMRELTIPLLKEFQSKLPIIFDDINL